MSSLIDYLTHFATCERAAGRAPATIEMRLRLARQLVRELGDPAAITAEALTAWLAQPDWKPYTRVTYRTSARAFFSCLHEAGLLPSDPSARLRPIRRPSPAPKPITDEELRAAIERSDGLWRTVITCAAYAGLRASEIAGLAREDISAERILIRSGKGNKDAVLPTHPAIWAAVRDLPAGPILHRPANEIPVTGRWLSSRQSAHFRSIGLPQVHLHRLRHTFATALLRSRERGGAGANLRVVQKLLRHSRLDTTALYTAVADDEMDAAIGALWLVAA